MNQRSSSRAATSHRKKIIYEIMHRENCVATVSESGAVQILHEQFLPYDLYLEPDEDDIDTRVNNLNNFYYWCSSCLLSLDRKYAKEL